MPATVPEGHILRAWLDSWAGIGHVTTGRARQGHDLQLTRYGNDGWRATFFTAGREHALTQNTTSAWEQTPWRAVQRAALEVLRREGEPPRGSSPADSPASQ